MGAAQKITTDLLATSETNLRGNSLNVVEIIAYL